MVKCGRVAAATVFLVAGLAGGTAQAQSLPDPNDQPQLTAEPPLRVPDTARCDELVLDSRFDGFYVPNPDPVENPDNRGGVRYGQHKAGACPGPWAKVVLRADVSAREGINYDRIFEIYLGNAPLLSSSTSEPVGDSTNVHWQVEADVSDFADWLQRDQTVTGILNNAHWDGYFGIYYVQLTLSFYAADADHPAIDAPDYIGVLYPKDANGLPTNHGASGYGSFDANSADKFVAFSLDDLPRNLVSLYADLRAQGHGANEEFWHSGGKRQVELAIDGQVAGFAPIYPVLFTGANGPGNWMPIPSPRAWHLDPYRVDLTPFVGRLVDGQPHVFELRVPDATLAGDDYWLVGGTLFGQVDPATPMVQTTGELTEVTVDAAARESTVTGLDYAAERSGLWKGYVLGSAGRIDSEVSNHFDFSTPQIPLAYNNLWNWTTVTTTVPTVGDVTTRTEAREYSLRGTLGVAGAVPSALTLGDAATITVEGPEPYSSQFRLQMSTSGVGLASNIVQTETYCGSDSGGWSYNRTITAAGGYVSSDQGDLTPCQIQTLGGSSSGSSSGGSTSGGSTSGGSTSGGSTSSGSGSSSGSSGSSTGSSSGTSSGSSTSSSSSSGGSSGGDGSSSSGSSGAGPAPSSGGATAEGDGGRFGGGALGFWPMLLLLAGAGLRRRRRG
ncbi:MAG: peptide-N4-asparagine amidase [Stagnimonas sp.]|nr:peptide-N4-asparagine amidase [Stagnimonas sp.]